MIKVKLTLVLVTVYCGVVLGNLVNNRSNRTSRNRNETDDEFAKDLLICHLGQPNVADCIQSVAEQAKPHLARGIPSLGIQPLEPLKVPSIRLRQHNAPGSGFKYDAWFTDVTLKGLTDYSFNQLDVYPEELKITGNISLPHLEMTGDFVVLGHFQMLPVESTGKMSANFTSCTAAVEAYGARVYERMVVRDSSVRLRCSGPLQADLMEAHSTNKEMEKITNHIVGMHASEIVAEVRPAVETTLAMVLEDVANKILKHLPHEMVFSD